MRLNEDANSNCKNKIERVNLTSGGKLVKVVDVERLVVEMPLAAVVRSGAGTSGERSLAVALIVASF